MTSAYGNKVFTGDTLRIPNLQRDTLFYVCAEPSVLDTGSLTTITTAGNGCGGGAMFNIVPNTNLRVDSFAARFAATGTQTVNVYYRVGTYAGNETTAGAWTLLGTTNVNVTSTTVLTNFTVNTPLFLTSANTYGIYVNYNASYTNGNANYSNVDMTIQTGTGLCSQFGGTNASRMFNGTVFYSKSSASCESPLEPIRAYAGPAPVVNLGVDITPCEDLDVILDAGHFGGSYIWNTQQFTQTINVKNTPGIYWVEVDKYCKGSDTVKVDIAPLPKVSGISYQRIANAYKFTAAGIQYANKIMWLFGDGNSSIMQSPDHVYATDGIYKVMLILTNDCGSDTTIMTLPLGVSNIAAESNGVLLFPNPATDRLTLEFDKIPNAASDMIIVNSVGTVVLKQKTNGYKKQNIDISKLPSGNYVLRILNDNTSYTKPFVINR